MLSLPVHVQLISLSMSHCYVVSPCTCAAPDPPQELRFERSDINLTSYQFFWARPDEVNGELSQYKLTCLPSGGGAPITMTFDPPETSGEVTGFKFLRQYQCFVQARNMAALSLPSDRVSFNVTESGKCMVMIALWEMDLISFYSLCLSTRCNPDGLLGHQYRPSVYPDGL